MVLCFTYSKFPTYSLVDESAWMATSISNRIVLLRLKLLMKGIRLNHVTLDLSQVADKQCLEDVFYTLLHSEIVVLDPVVSFACNSLDIDAKSILSDSCVNAINSDNSKHFFTCNLKSCEDKKWMEIHPDDNVIICKSADEITACVESLDNKKFLIVDYRFASAVPRKMLYGVVEPKLETAFRIQSGEIELNYAFRKTLRRIF